MPRRGNALLLSLVALLSALAWLAVQPPFTQPAVRAVKTTSAQGAPPPRAEPPAVVTPGTDGSTRRETVGRTSEPLEVTLAPAAAPRPTPTGTDHVTSKTGGHPFGSFLGRLPLRFESVGESEASCGQFMTHGAGGTAYIAAQRLTFLVGSSGWSGGDGACRESLSPPAWSRIDLQFAGGDLTRPVEVVERLPGVSNYYGGDDPSRWRVGVEHVARLRVRDVYPGVDVEYYGNEQGLEFDFVLRPGASPDAIRIDFAGAHSVRVGDEGDLVIETDSGELRFRQPRAYQLIADRRSDVSARYALSGHSVRLEVGSFDSSAALVVDPVVVYSSYFGNTEVLGSPSPGETSSSVSDLAIDSFGNVIVVGSAIAKINAAGTTLLYWTSVQDGYRVAVDAFGNAYVAGATARRDFPTVSAVQPTYGGGSADAVVFKLNPSGAIVYSTYLGGDQSDAAYDIAVDSGLNAFVVGTSAGGSFPIVNAIQPVHGGGTGPLGGRLVDGFLAKVNLNGNAILFSTFLGGASNDFPNGVAVDPSGNAYVAGTTYSSDFLVANAIQGSRRGTIDGFLMKVSADGQSLAYSTFFGGTLFDEITSVAVDATGRAHVTGFTGSTDFPIVNALQASLAGPEDGFVAKFEPSGQQLAFSTYLGGGTGTADGVDRVRAMALDATGHIYVAGDTNALDYPTVSAFQPGPGGRIPGDHWQGDAFVAKLGPDGSTVAYSSYLGAPNTVDDSGEGAKAIAVDPVGNVYVVGMLVGMDFPIVNALWGTPFYYGGYFIQRPFLVKIGGPDATGCTFALDTSSRDVAPAGGSATFTVSTTPECYWFVTSTDTFVSAGSTRARASTRRRG